MKTELDELIVEVTTLIEARPATVFKFLSEPARFSEWIDAAVTMTPEAGSALRIDFAEYDTIVAGEILEVEQDRRIVFTWGAEKGPQRRTIPPGSTTVSIDLEPEGDATRVTLRHAGLPDDKERQDHRGGWLHHLHSLARKTVEQERGVELEQRVAAYFEAWNEQDPNARAKLIESFWAPEGEWIDKFGRFDGREALDAHIGGARARFPGLSIRLASKIRQTHEYASFDWSGVEDGKPAGGGTDVVTLDSDGRIARLVGFWED